MGLLLAAIDGRLDGCCCQHEPVRLGFEERELGQHSQALEKDFPIQTKLPGRERREQRVHRVFAVTQGEELSGVVVLDAHAPMVQGDQHVVRRGVVTNHRLARGRSLTAVVQRQLSAVSSTMRIPNASSSTSCSASASSLDGSRFSRAPTRASRGPKATAPGHCSRNATMRVLPDETQFRLPT